LVIKTPYRVMQAHGPGAHHFFGQCPRLLFPGSHAFTGLATARRNPCWFTRTL